MQTFARLFFVGSLLGACATDSATTDAPYRAMWSQSSCAPTDMAFCPSELRSDELTFVSDGIAWMIDEDAITDAGYIDVHGTLVLPAEQDPASFQYRALSVLAPTSEGWQGIVTWQPSLPITATLTLSH